MAINLLSNFHDDDKILATNALISLAGKPDEDIMIEYLLKYGHVVKSVFENVYLRIEPYRLNLHNPPEPLSSIYKFVKFQHDQIVQPLNYVTDCRIEIMERLDVTKVPHCPMQEQLHNDSIVALAGLPFVVILNVDARLFWISKTVLNYLAEERRRKQMDRKMIGIIYDTDEVEWRNVNEFLRRRSEVCAVVIKQILDGLLMPLNYIEPHSNKQYQLEALKRLESILPDLEVNDLEIMLEWGLKVKLQHLYDSSSHNDLIEITVRMLKFLEQPEVIENTDKSFEMDIEPINFSPNP